MKKIAILGSTGSIGTQTLSIVAEHGDIDVVAMSCGRNIALFEEQVRKFKPAVVSVERKEDAEKLKTNIAGSGVKTKIRYGEQGLIDVATCPDAEVLVTAIVGMRGIRPTVAAIEAGKDIALANKETLVAAGHIIMPLAKEKGVSILPVDSEHSAIFQSLQGNENNDIARILLTASGGPFRGKSYEELEHVTLQDALKHPNWSMGKKVTIDSATMVNKGLEVIEASHLFHVPVNRIRVLVHPQSILHSAVEYEDGSVIGQMGLPDMRLPIQYALYYPNRPELSGDRLDLDTIGSLTFEEPDMETFFGLQLAFDAALAGGNMPCIFNAANERAVALFIEEKIPFLRIPELISEAMGEVDFISNPSLDDIFETEQATYRFIDSALS